MEIKYRAWDKFEKKMYNVLAFDFDLVRTDEEENLVLFDVIILRNTNYKDMNNNYIFEGDILETKEEVHMTGFVEREGEEYYINGFNLKDLNLKYFKIIGNIYENPDLIGDIND